MTTRKHLSIPDFAFGSVAIYNGVAEASPILNRTYRIGVGENQYWSTVHEWTGTVWDMFAQPYRSEDEKGSPLYPHYVDEKHEGRWLLSGMTVAQEKAEKPNRQFAHKGWGDRKDLKMESNCLMMFDFDLGTPLHIIIKRLREHNVAAMIYTTTSHLKTESHDATPKKIADVQRKYGIEDIEEAVKTYYLKEKKIDRRIVDTMEVETDWIDKDGRQYYPVSHEPIPKYRVILFLKEPFLFRLVDEQVSADAQVEEWRENYERAASFFGFSMADRSCKNPARLMYAPQFPPGTVLGNIFEDDTVHGIGYIVGDFFDFDIIKNDRVANFVDSLPAMGTPRGGKVELKTPDLADFLRAHRDDFQIVDWLRDVADELIVRAVDQDKVEIRCPRDEWHSDPDRAESSAAWASQSGSDGAGWNLRCQTDGCQSHYSEQQGWFNKWQMLDDFIQEYNLIEKSAWELEKWCDETRRVGEADLPYGFSRQDGKILVEVKAQKDTYTVPVCQDFEILARARSPEGNEWGRIIQFKTEDGEEKRFFVPDRDLAGDGKALRERLRSEGFWIGTAAKAREGLLRLFNELEVDKKATRCIKPGWYDSGDAKVFVAPNGEVYGEVADDDFFMLDGEREAGFEPRGDEAKWREGITCCLRPETPHWALGVCVGVAGTIVDLLPEPSFGINFYGSSSTGKTTAQKIAAGMWGSPEPDQGLLYTCRSTDNAMEFLLERGNGTSIHLDEAKTGKSKELADLAFFISGGVGKKRMRADASERESKTWRTVATISSEKPMSSIVSEANTAEVSGLHVRMPAIDVSGLNPLPASEAADIRQLLLKNYGFGGYLFVKALIDLGYHEDASDLRGRINHREAELRKATDLATVKRTARQLAIVWVCGDILREAGIVEMETDKFGDAVQWAWQTWLNGDDARKLAPVSDSVDTLITFIQNNPHRVADCKFANNSNQEVLAYYDEEMIYLPVASLNKIPGLQSSPSAILKGLDERGMLIRQGKNMPHQHIPGVGAGRPHYRLEFRLYEKKDVMAQACEWMQRSPNDSVGQLQRDG